MRRLVVGWLVVTLAGFTVALGAAAKAASASTPIDVVASFYPVAFAAQQVGGGRVAVSNLTPAGAEPHDLELSTRQIDEILDADVVFTMGRQFQPAVDNAAKRRDGPTVTILDHISHNALLPDDQHVWLDPVLMRDIVEQVRRTLTKADPKGRATYQRNADALAAQLDALDARYRAGLAKCTRDLVVTSHEAFGYLTHRYGLRQEGVSGLSPDAEPDPRRIAELADLASRHGVTVIFTETLVSPRIADTLAREVGVKTEVLDPLEGLTKHEIAHGATYLSVMNANLRKLRRALDCT